jgi:hypothetical protein
MNSMEFKTMRKKTGAVICFLFFILLTSTIATSVATSGTQTEASDRFSTAGPVLTRSAAPKTSTGNPAPLPSDWSELENASNTPNFSQTPVAALDGKGNVYICWDEWFGDLGDRRDIMFNTNKSGQWQSQRANTLQYDLIYEIGFPEVAATMSGADVIYAWMDRDLAREQMVIDWDEFVNGAWTGLRWISDQVAGSSRRVTIAASPVDDTICLVWEQDVPSGVNLVYQYRDGANGRMSAPALIFSGQSGSQYLPNICVDGLGTAHVVYSSGATDRTVWYTRNSDPKNLAGWTIPVALSGGTGLSRSFPKVAAAADGDAYVVWSERRGGNEEVYLRFQVQGTWQTAVALTQTPDFSEYPSVSVNPVTKDVYVSWSESPDDLTANIMVKTFETDRASGIRAWSQNYQVDSNDASEQSCIRANEKGDVHLVFAEGGEIWHVQRLGPRLFAVQAPVVASERDQAVFSSRTFSPPSPAKARADTVIRAPRKSDTIVFSKNPANDDATLLEYRLYAKKVEEPDTGFIVLATFAPTDPLRYVHDKLEAEQRYAYKVGVVNKSGLELVSNVTISN